MGKGRDKRRRKAKREDEVRTAKIEPLGESFGPSDPYTKVLAPRKPKPPVGSGAIALPEPEDSELRQPEAISVKLSK